MPKSPCKQKKPACTSNIDIPQKFSIGIVIGPSGSGKTKFLQTHFGQPEMSEWNAEKAVVSQFGDPTTGELNNKASADEGIYRDQAVIDDFTAVVNRHAAWAMSASISRFIRQRGFKRVVFASSHSDVVRWLQPDWVIVLGASEPILHINPALGSPPESFRPVVNMTSQMEIAENDMERQYQQTWMLKSAANIDIAKVCRPKKEGGKKLEVQVGLDESTDRAGEAFDYEFLGKTVFDVPVLPEIPSKFSIGLLVGPSGSGKTTLLKENFSLPVAPSWDGGKPISSFFAGTDKLEAVGLVPEQWDREYETLSAGEKFRADLARCLQDGGVVDEYTSNVDRHLAKVVSHSVGVYARSKGIKRLVFATCHDDFVPWLQPDWVYSTQTRELLILNVQKPPELPTPPDNRVQDFELPVIDIQIRRNKSGNMWPLFAEYHYLDREINSSNQFFVAWWNGIPVGCVATMGFPGSVRQLTAKREHRCVVMPDFQGLGVGTRMSDAVASHVFVNEKRFYFSRTAHPRFGTHRENSTRWVGTSANFGFLELKGVYGSASRITGQFKETREKQKFRICFSHQYVGTEEERAAFKAAVQPHEYDYFEQTHKTCLARDAKNKKKTMDQIKEEARAKLKKKSATETQSGKTAFSKGGVLGPNKLECLVAFGNLKPGRKALELVVNKKTYYGDLIADRDAGGLGKIEYKGVSFGDVLTFSNAVMADAEANPLKSNADCWKRIMQGGRTLQQLKTDAAVEAKAKNVNPRSIKEWKALADGDLGKIRKLGGAGADDGVDASVVDSKDTTPKKGSKKSQQAQKSAVAAEGDKQKTLEMMWKGGGASKKKQNKKAESEEDEDEDEDDDEEEDEEWESGEECEEEEIATSKKGSSNKKRSHVDSEQEEEEDEFEERKPSKKKAKQIIAEKPLQNKEEKKVKDNKVEDKKLKSPAKASKELSDVEKKRERDSETDRGGVQDDDIKHKKNKTTGGGVDDTDAKAKRREAQVGDGEEDKATKNQAKKDSKNKVSKSSTNVDKSTKASKEDKSDKGSPSKKSKAKFDAGAKKERGDEAQDKAGTKKGSEQEMKSKKQEEEGESERGDDEEEEEGEDSGSRDITEYQVEENHDLVHKFLYKTFDGTSYLGKVAAWLPPDESGEALFYVIYSDGDREDLSEQAARACVKRCQKEPSGSEAVKVKKHVESWMRERLLALAASE